MPPRLVQVATSFPWFVDGLIRGPVITDQNPSGRPNDAVSRVFYAVNTARRTGHRTGPSLASSRPRQQRRPGAQGSQEEDAARGYLSRDEASWPLREAVGEAGARIGRGGATGAETGSKEDAARRPSTYEAAPSRRRRRPALTLNGPPRLEISSIDESLLISVSQAVTILRQTSLSISGRFLIASWSQSCPIRPSVGCCASHMPSMLLPARTSHDYVTKRCFSSCRRSVRRAAEAACGPVLDPFSRVEPCRV